MWEAQQTAREETALYFPDKKPPQRGQEGDMSDQQEAGDKLSITQAFYAVEQSLRTYLMRFLARQQDIEDTVQETFLRAYEAEKVTEIRAPKSFLFKVAKNLALSEIVRKTNKMMVTVGDLEELDVIDGRSSLEDDLEAEKYLKSLSRVVATLPPKCQTVLMLRKVYGFSHKEIARRMDISVKTVEKHLTKALHRCQQALPEGYEGGFGTLGAGRGEQAVPFREERPLALAASDE